MKPSKRRQCGVHRKETCLFIFGWWRCRLSPRLDLFFWP